MFGLQFYTVIYADERDDSQIMWQAISYVSSGVTLAAFIFAVGAYVYRRNILQKERLIKSAPKDQRPGLINDIPISGMIDPNSLSQSQRYDIILNQFKQRAHRFAISASIVVLIAILSATVATIAILKSKPGLETDDLPPIPDDIAATALGSSSEEPQIPEIRNATKEIRIRSLDQIKVQRAKGIKTHPDDPDGYFDLEIKPNKGGAYSWARVETSQLISTHFFATVKLAASENIKTVELVGHNFFFVVDSSFRAYLLWNAEENMSEWRPLPQNVSTDSNTIGLYQNGRKVQVFFNAKYLDSYELWDVPSKGTIGLYFKTDPDNGGSAIFRRFNIWEF